MFALLQQLALPMLMPSQASLQKLLGALAAFICFALLALLLAGGVMIMGVYALHATLIAEGIDPLHALWAVVAITLCGALACGYGAFISLTRKLPAAQAQKPDGALDFARDVADAFMQGWHESQVTPSEPKPHSSPSSDERIQPLSAVSH